MPAEARYNLEDIVGLVTPIISQYSAVHRAFIFGSYARGRADEISDIDIRIDTAASAQWITAAWPGVS